EKVAFHLGVTVDWLIGRSDQGGPGYQAEQAGGVAEPPPGAMPPTIVRPGVKTVDLPVFSVQAGSQVWYDDAEFPKGQSDTFIRVEDIHDPNAFGLEIRGDSMDDGSPAGLSEGSFVIASPNRPAEINDLVIARLQDQTTVAQFVRCRIPDAVQLHKWNSTYHDLVVPKEQVVSIWKIVLTIRRHF
ncbi:MAG: S24 family peptidase, partial [Gammaproteobacteria bacterium]|nr:S24 family peptidase [Gammaproteobacteria bacterium]